MALSNYRNILKVWSKLIVGGLAVRLEKWKGWFVEGRGRIYLQQFLSRSGASNLRHLIIWLTPRTSAALPTTLCDSLNLPLLLPLPPLPPLLPRYCLINHVVLIKARLIEFADFTPLIRVSFKLNEASFPSPYPPLFCPPLPCRRRLETPGPPSNRSFSLAVLLIFIPSGYRVLVKRFTKR